MARGGKIFLGVDLGTTTIKLCLVDEEKSVVQEVSAPHNATIPHEQLPSPKWHEQCVKGIMACVGQLLAQLDVEKMSRLAAIAVTGQMHGTVLWEAASIAGGRSMAEWNCSRLITWMDERFEEDSFLQRLPQWNNSHAIDSQSGHFLGPLTPLANGFGCATLAWLKARGELEGKGWDRAGTLMDFLTSLLADPQQREPVVMSTQNASGWGYCIGERWYMEKIKEAGTPVELLPRILPVGSAIGETSGRESKDHTAPTSSVYGQLFPGIPKGVKVLVGMGDMPCSLLPVLNPKRAAIQMGTSTIIGFAVDTVGLSPHQMAEQLSPIYNFSKGSAIVVPFFDTRLLAVVCAINGGNALEAFVQEVARWANSLFGIPMEQMQLRKGYYDEAFAYVDKRSSASKKPDELSVRPLFFTERHATPDEKGGAEVRNWKPGATAADFSGAIARGLIANLAELMPESLLMHFGIEELLLTNRAASGHLFEEEARRQFPHLRVTREETTFSAAYAAALVAMGEMKR